MPTFVSHPAAATVGIPPQTSAAFTPGAGNALLALAFGADTTTTITGTGTYSLISPPGFSADTDGDTWGVFVNPNASAVSQTLTVAGVSFVGAIPVEYSSVGSISNGQYTNRTGIASGASIAGQTQSIPMGCLLLTWFISTTSASNALTASTAGTPITRWLAPSSATGSFIVCEYAGGQTVTPAATSTEASGDFVIVQLILNPPASLALGFGSYGKIGQAIALSATLPATLIATGGRYSLSGQQTLIPGVGRQMNIGFNRGPQSVTASPGKYAIMSSGLSASRSGTNSFSLPLVRGLYALSGRAISLSFTTAGVLSYIKSLVGTGKILLGQHSNYFDPNPLDNITPLPTPVAILGVTPSNGANGVNFSNESNPSDPVYYAPILANQQIASNGIVILNYWLGNPTNGVMINGDVTAIVNPTNDLTQMLISGTSQHTNWQNCKATMISQIKSISGTVIVRPFFEMEGNWFWFGSASSAAYIAAWQDMVTSIRPACPNALFFWCSNGGGFNYWPGAAFVDIGGMDSYPPGGAPALYGQITSLGIPFMIGEAGVISAANPSPNTGDNNALLQSVKSNMPLCVGLNYFCQNWSLTAQNGEAAVFADPAIITRNELPPGV